MHALLRSFLMVALLVFTAACSRPPAAEPDVPNDSAPADAPGSSEGAGGERADEPYPGAQPVDGRSPTPAYPGPGEEGAADESGEDGMEDADEEGEEGAADDEGEGASDEVADDADAAAAGGSMLMLDDTYSSADFGYSVDHPAGWLVDDSGPVVMLFSEDTSDQPGRDGVPAHMTKIDIVLLEGFPLDIETRVSQIREELDSVSEEERFDLVGGEAATWLRGEGGMAGDTGIVVTILGGQLYQLQAYGNPAPLRAIAETFRVED